MNRILALEILGLELGATAQQVKTAYRRGALKCHPDKGGSRADFIKIKQAYDCLVEYGTGSKDTEKKHNDTGPTWMGSELFRVVLYEWLDDSRDS